MGSPYKWNIRLLGYYPSHIICLITLLCELCSCVTKLIDLIHIKFRPIINIAQLNSQKRCVRSATV